MDSLSSWAESTRSAFPESQTDPFHDFLGLIDVEFLTAVEFTNFRNNFTDVGRALSPAHGHVLGAGGTYIVRRIPFDASAHRVAALGEPWRYSNSGFVALKQQKLIDDRDSIVRVQDVDRMRAAMMEMKILRHQPIRNHPNIINLLQMRWDVQDDFRLVVPSVVMEIGDYGTLADFQDAEILALNSVTKKRICLDTARGLQFLHECGIVHGDVKSENILLCKNPEGEYLAKLSDFGSSLLEVFEDSPRRRIAGTSGWGAPESHLRLDSLGLRRVDVYSFGLLAWRVMLNGVKPWERLAKADGDVWALGPGESQDSVTMLTSTVFDSLKGTGPTDRIPDLAKNTFTGCYRGDVDFDTVCKIFHRTLQKEPDLRVQDFRDVISLLQNNRDLIKFPNADATVPQPLRYGDFGLGSLRLPWQIFTLSSCPVSFRRLLCSEMLRVFGKLDETDPRKVQLQVALAICHIQNFAPKPSIQYATELIYQSAKAGSKRAQHMSISCFDTSGMPYPAELEGWLVAGVRRGSALSRLSLAKLNSMVLRNVDQQISDSRQRLGDRWLRKIIASGLEWLKLTQAIADDTDDILNFFARRDGTSPLHLAALTGNARLIEYLLGHDSVDIESKNAHGETPLHYASISRSTPAIQILCERGASVNAQTQLHATPIHYAVLAFVPSDALQCLSVHEADLNISSDSMDSLQETIFSDYYFRLTGTPLAWATAIENLDAADTLLKYGSDPFSGDVQSSECPSWQLAFSNRSLDIIQLLFSRSKAVERPFIKFDEIVPHLGQESTTPLRLIVHGSLARNHFVRQVLNLLVSLGVEVDEMGVVCQLLDVQLFPEATVDIVEDIISRKGLQPTTDFGVYRLRSFNSDNIFICPLTLDTFLASALTGGSVEMVRMLFKRIGNLKTTIVPQIQYLETNPPQPDVHRTYFELLADTPFRSEHEMADLVECLLAHGADRSAKGSAPLREKQCCPLRYAVYAHRFAAVKTFLDYGIGDAFGALARALEDSNSLLSLPIVTLILDKRPEVLLEDIPIDSGLEYTYTIPGIGMPAGEEPPVGLTAFMSILCNLNELDRNDAITEKKLLRIRKAVEELPVGRVAMRKVVCTPDFLGSTLLHYAARNANMPLCEMLLHMGADVNATEDILGFNTMFPDLSDLAAMTQQLNVALAEGQSVSSTLESTSLDTIGMQSAAMPLTALNTNAPFSLLKGPTPLDRALQREWSTSLRSQAFFQDEVNKLHNLAGDHKQRKDFCRRTDEVVQYLRGKGGKTSSEIREIFQNDF